MRIRAVFLVATCLTLPGLFMPSFSPAAAPTARDKPEAPITLAPTVSVPTPAGEQPRYGGVVTRAVDRDVPSFDLQREQGGDASTTIFNVYQGLVRLHPNHDAACEIGSAKETTSSLTRTVSGGA